MENELLIAVTEEQVEIISSLIAQGADINKTDRRGKYDNYYYKGDTILNHAVKSGNTSIVKLLLDAGADVQSSNITGLDVTPSPLQIAVELNNIDISKMLINAAADFNVQYFDGTSLLHTAVISNNINMSKLLVSAGVDVDAEDYKKMTALHYAVQSNNIEISKLLVAAGAIVNVNMKVEYLDNGHSLLQTAIMSNNVCMAKILIDGGANVNVKYQDDSSLLHWAVKSNNINIAKILIDYEIDLNCKDGYGMTALSYAVKSNNTDLTKLLVEAGADVNQDESLALAYERRNMTLLKSFLNTTPNLNIKREFMPLHMAIRHGNSKIVKILLENGADVNLKDLNGRTPIRHAIISENMKIFNLIVDAGANTDDLDDYANTLLHEAAESRNPNILKFLLKSNIEINAKNSIHLETPINISTGNKDVNIMKLLIRSGAHVDFLSYNGFTLVDDLILHSSTKKDNDLKNNLSLLIKYTNINTCNSHGNNCLFRTLTHHPPLSKNKFYHEIILEHLAKLKILGLNIDLCLLDFVYDNNLLNGYFTTCIEELERAKTFKLKNCWVTFLNLLVDRQSKLVKFVGNIDLVTNFQEFNFGEAFSIYGATIQSRVNKAIHNRKLYDTAVINLSNQLPVFNPTHLIIKNTLETLNKEDWKKLSE